MDDYAGFEPQVGEIRALRTFRIGADGLLYPLFSDRAWTDGDNAARCNIPPAADQIDRRPHVAPEPDCTCGYYAYATEYAAAENARARHVLAVVACWGNVVAGTRGLRAGHARVEALWMSDSVPGSLAGAVAARYPSTSIYGDKAAMLAEHAPTELECYEDDAPGVVARSSRGMRLAILSALAVGALPASWIWPNQDIRLVWAAQLCLFVGSAAVLLLTRSDVRARGATLFYAAIALWLIAPFAGQAGIYLLRVPMLQVAGLGLIQRAHLNREARRFPAPIGRPER